MLNIIQKWFKTQHSPVFHARKQTGLQRNLLNREFTPEEFTDRVEVIGEATDFREFYIYNTLLEDLNL